MRAVLAAVLCALLVPAPARAFGASGRGTAAAAFLNLSPGARQAALGGAAGGIADDSLAAHYNPAGLASLGRIEGAAGREARFEGLNYDYAVLSVPVLAWTDREGDPAAWGVAAAGVYSLAASGIERRGLTETDAPAGTFSSAERAFALSYGKSLDGGLSAGATLKYVDVALDTARGSALTGDAGLLWRGESWSFGGGARNAHGRLSLGSGSDPLPGVLHAGAGFRPGKGWLLAAQLEQPRYDAPALAFGVERVVPVSRGLAAAARAGFRTDRTDAGALGGLTLGFGVEWKGLASDVAWSPGGTLGSVAQYSIRGRF